MRKHTRKLVSIILSITLIFGVLPISALASEAENPNTGLIETIEATAAADGDTNDTTDDITDDTTDITDDTDGTTGDGGGGLLLATPDEASCTCESFCSDADCVVCKDDATQCFYYYCICEAVCAEGEANPDCPICKDDFSKCAQAVEVPEFEAMVVENRTLYFKAPMGFGNLFVDEAGTIPYTEQSDKWDANGSTLTLDGFSFSTSAANALVMPSGTTINLVGTSTITNTEDTGIISTGDVTISGSGSLSVSGNYGSGIEVGNLTIDGGTVTASSGITGIMVTALNINGGTVTATGGFRAISVAYIVPSGYTYWKNTSTSAPTGEGTVSTGHATNDKIDVSHGYAKIVAVPNYSLNLDDTDGKLYKYVNYVNGDDVTDEMADLGAVVTGSTGAWTLTLNNFEFQTTAIFGLIVPEGTTIVTEGNNKITTTSSTGGTRGISGTNTLTISGTGTLAANGGTGTTGNGSIGIHCPNLTISGGTVIAAGATRALSHDYTVPTGYSYWRNTYRSDPQGDAEISTGSETAHKIGSTHKFAKIVAGGNNYTLHLYGESGGLFKNSEEGANVTTEMAAAGAVVTGSAGARILTLTNFSFETSAATALYVPTGTTIRLIGNNTIETTATSEGVAIICPGDLKINGTGSLNAATNSTGLGFPAIVAGSLTVEGSPVITATTGTDVVVLVNAGNLNMTGGTLIATSASATGYGLMVQAGDLTMTGGTIYAKNGTVAALVSGNVPGNVVVQRRSGNAYDVVAMFSASPFGKITTTPAGYPNMITDARITVSGTPPAPPVPPVPPTPTPSGGGGSSQKEEPAKPIIAPMDDKSSGTLNNAINSAANATNSDGKALDVKFKNVSNFTQENAAAIIAKAKALGKKATVSSDIMSEDGKFIEVRVTLDPELITKTVRLDGYIRQVQIFATESKFKKHFGNKTTVVNLGQEGKFGQTAKIAAKVDLSGFDSNNLCFYSYDKKTNQFTHIAKPAYRIDQNGYLHFETDTGGDIIISNGRLEKK